MVFFTACAQMPEGTSEMTEEQRVQAEEIVGQAEVITPIVEDLLDVSNPLFDLHGNQTEDNSELREGVRLVMDEVEVIWEGNRFVTMPDGEFPQGDQVAAAAYGLGTDTELDNYIVLGVGEDGWIINSPGEVMHEGSHYFFGMHDSEMKKFLKEKGERMTDTELLKFCIERKDASYTVGALYEVFYNLSFYSRRFVEAGENVNDHAQDASYNEGPTAQHNRDAYYNKLLRWQTKDGWANELVDSGLYDGVQEQLDVLGVTKEEFLQVFIQQDELFKVHKEGIDLGLEAFREMYPEYQQEMKPERSSEIRLR